MRKEFHGHFPLSERDLAGLMKEALFVFDTNVLLNLYRYSASTREDYLRLLERLRDRVCIPFQVGSEFFENRIAVITEHNAIASKLSKDLEAIHNKARGDLEAFKRHPVIDIPKLVASIDDAFKKAAEEIAGLTERRPSIDVMNDPILDRLASIFEGKIREEPSHEKAIEIEKWADSRYKMQIPPGYKDADKSGINKYGDAKIWWDILEIGREAKKPLIFVTDDVKEDWWLRPKGGRTLGPRPQLRHEFRKEARQEFHMYQADRFLEVASASFNAVIDKESVSEAAEVRDRLSTKRPAAADLDALLEKRNSIKYDLRDVTDRLARLRARFGSNPSQKVQEMIGRSVIQVDALSATLASLDATIARRFGIEDKESLQQAGRLKSAETRHRIVLQQYHEQGDGFHKLGLPEEVELFPSEIEQIEGAEAVEWLERLGGHYAIA